MERLVHLAETNRWIIPEIQTCDFAFVDFKGEDPHIALVSSGKSYNGRSYKDLPALIEFLTGSTIHFKEQRVIMTVSRAIFTYLRMKNTKYRS